MFCFVVFGIGSPASMKSREHYCRFLFPFYFSFPVSAFGVFLLRLFDCCCCCFWFGGGCFVFVFVFGMGSPAAMKFREHYSRFLFPFYFPFPISAFHVCLVQLFWLLLFVRFYCLKGVVLFVFSVFFFFLFVFIFFFVFIRFFFGFLFCFLSLLLLPCRPSLLHSTSTLSRNVTTGAVAKRHLMEVAKITSDFWSASLQTW